MNNIETGFMDLSEAVAFVRGDPEFVVHAV